MAPKFAIIYQVKYLGTSKTIEEILFRTRRIAREFTNLDNMPFIKNKRVPPGLL